MLSVSQGLIYFDNLMCCHTELDHEPTVVGGQLLNVPATCWCISGMGLLRQLYMPPH